MPYVVTEPCIKCKYTDCVDVCPVDCFTEGENFLAINPDECIDCGACVPECPTEAIFEEIRLTHAAIIAVQEVRDPDAFAAAAAERLADD